MKIISAFILSVVLLCPAFSAGAQQHVAEVSDTTQYSTDYRFSARQLILPGALIATGAAFISNNWIAGLDRHIGGHDIKADSYLQYLPAAAYLGMGALGVECKHGIRDRLLAGATAAIALGVMTEGMKLCIDERRPDGSDSRSFPSGHAAKAFAGAELIRLEYGTWYAIGAYSVATAVAVLRVCNSRHRLNDVVAGAGIGILSARIGYWMLPVYRKWFRLDSMPQTACAALPYYSPTDRSAGIAFTAVF